MKKIVLIIALALLSFSYDVEAKTDADSLWERANALYTAGDYQGAVTLYDSIESAGYESARLFYNQGNAYFKSGATGKAVLYYNKALRLSPGDEEAKYNLKVASAYVKDRIEVVPEFFLETWMRSLMNSISCNGWAALSLLFFAAALASAALYLLSTRLGRRKAGFYGALSMIVLFIASVSFATMQREKLLNPDEAVVMASAAPVKGAPDNGSKDIFILHEGTKVTVKSSLGEWREIAVADGNRGWISASSIEMID